MLQLARKMPGRNCTPLFKDWMKLTAAAIILSAWRSMLNACILWICSWGQVLRVATAGAEFILSALPVSSLCSPILRAIWPRNRLAVERAKDFCPRIELPRDGAAAGSRLATATCFLRKFVATTYYVANDPDVERSSAKKKTWPSRRRIFSCPKFLFRASIRMNNLIGWKTEII